MRASAVAVSLVLLSCIAGCGSGSKVTSPGGSQPPASSTRSYNGTASVGDFLNLTVDGTAHTLHYFNRSNGDSGTVGYTVNGDGSWTIADPTGNLVAAYEVPNFVLLVQAAKTGPGHDQPSLVTAVQASPVSIASMANARHNYMQFRTASGGVEIGSAVSDNAGQVTNSSYWPYGAQNASHVFNNGLVSLSSFVPDSSGTFMRLPDGVGQYDYLFGTPNGVFAVDSPNGAIMGFTQTATKNFDPATAGTYHAIVYAKVGATTGAGNVESGTGTLGKGTVTVTAGGVLTIADGAGTMDYWDFKVREFFFSVFCFCCSRYSSFSLYLFRILLRAFSRYCFRASGSI